MNKKHYIFIGLSIILISSLLYFILSQNKEENYEDIDTIIAIPINSELIIHIPDLEHFIKKTEKNTICQEFYNWESLQDFKQNIIVAKKQLGEDKFAELIDNSQLTISTKIAGRNNIEFSYILPLQNKTNKERLSKLLTHFFKDYSEEKRNYSGFDIHHLKHNSDNKEYFYSFAKGLLIFCTSQIPMEDALLQISNNNSLLAKESFNRLQKIASSNDDLNIFINGSNFSHLLSIGVAKPYKRFVKELTEFTETGGLDINFGDNKILLNGFLYTGTDALKYTNILLNQKATKNTMETVIPANTVFWSALSLSAPQAYMDNYKRYLEHTGDIKKYRNFSRAFKKQSNLFPENSIYPYLDSEIGLVVLENKVKDIQPERFCLIKTKSQSETRQHLNLLLKKYQEKGNKLEQVTQYKIDENLYYTIQPFPFPQYANNMWGGLFYETETNYFSFIDNYLILGKSVEDLKKYINAIVRRKTLEFDDFYQKQKKYWIDNESSFIAYMRNTQSKKYLTGFLNEQLKEEFLNKKTEILDKFPSLGLQMKAIKDMLYINAYIAYDKQPKKIPQTIWQSRLDAPLQTKPTLVKNHNTGERELLVQDRNNTLYLLSNNGHILWKRPMKEDIKGTVHQVDAYKNNKIQYLFNTQSQLFLVDRNGNDVEGFPQQLHAPATNGIAVFDYDKKKNYRIFVATKDKRIYLYNIKGKLIKGWKSKPSEHLVSQPIQHFVCSGKDYISYNDGYKNYILNRKGETRVKPVQNFTKAPNSIVSIVPKTKYQKCQILATDTLGIIHSTTLDGKVSQIKVGTFSANHFFQSLDINNDNRTDFIFIDKNKLSVFKSSGQLLFQYKFKTTDIGKPHLYHFSSQNKKLGVRAGEQIYLFNSTGTLYDGFPLNGHSDFSIGFTSPTDTDFNLFVAGKKDLLYNYEVK